MWKIPSYDTAPRQIKQRSKKEDKKQGDTQANSKTPENDKSEKAEKICRSTHTGAGDGQGPSPCILPVQIQCRTTGIVVNTLAYLDSGSDAVFCTDQLRQQLGIKGKRTTLQVKTLTDERSVETYILKGLEVCSVDGNHRIPLPDVYTQKSIPADSKDMVTEEEIRKWSSMISVLSGPNLTLEFSTFDLLKKTSFFSRRPSASSKKKTCFFLVDLQ